MEELVSVIVPIYNVELYLNDCVSSLVNQTYQKLEIILVDDGSPDKCPEICDYWRRCDQRIKVIHKQNGGLSDARNAGLEIATGQYIIFVDSDDWLKTNAIEQMYKQMILYNADICACGIISCSVNGERSWGIPQIFGGPEQILPMLYKDTQFPVAAWNKLYRADLWKSFRFPVGKICEDAMTTYLLVDKSKMIVQIKEPLYCYRIREGSIMTSKFSHKRMDEETAWKENYQYMNKKYPKIGKLAFDFYLLKVCQLAELAKKSDAPSSLADFEYLHDVLHRNIMHILFFSSLTLKLRIKTVLDIVRL